jgi:hypothetical protein
MDDDKKHLFKLIKILNNKYEVLQNLFQKKLFPRVHGGMMVKIDLVNN